MAGYKLPELNSVLLAGNLTKDPVYRLTNSGTPVANFGVACNRRFRDKSDEWKEDVCYVGVIAWNRLADSCKARLKKGSAVLVDGELQSRTFKTDDNSPSRTIVEIKAKRIQFLNRKEFEGEHGEHKEEEVTSFTDDSFDSLLSPEDSTLIKSTTNENK